MFASKLPAAPSVDGDVAFDRFEERWRTPEGCMRIDVKDRLAGFFQDAGDELRLLNSAHTARRHDVDRLDDMIETKGLQRFDEAICIRRARGSVEA